ncbi:hypothetical protein Zmor_007023 [Zophobas morio]|uniref:Uncharacterized protein n=1 Tax=Zophobas morio TaxID=2755281 RepID=A0AA38IW00_9CUCU|nr:hypothetical protein Zmor_007023 [Zophobas morio]
MDSDSSSYCETTYSEDQRIEKALLEEKRIRALRAAEEDQARRKLFENYAKEDLPIFKLPGIKFHTFRHLKIKFSFEPSKITAFVNKNVKFFISLKYNGKYWRVKRSSFPLTCNRKIYPVFNDQYFIVDDENILTAITKMYQFLVEWKDNEEEFRLEKYERYKKGEEDVELDSDDEQLFLSQNERVALYQKRIKVLKRMLPPKT